MTLLLKALQLIFKKDSQAHSYIPLQMLNVYKPEVKHTNSKTRRKDTCVTYQAIVSQGR